MRDVTVARNYAETLLELAERQRSAETFGEGLKVIARLLDENPRFRTFLETPRIPGGQKKDVIRRVLGESLPPTIINFVLVTLDRRRQRLLRAIADEYQTLLDALLNRERVEVTVAREMDPSFVDQLQGRLTALLGRQATARMRVKPRILGGVVIRAGDTIYDGSLQRRIDGMRRSLLATQLPGADAS